MQVKFATCNEFAMTSVFPEDSRVNLVDLSFYSDFSEERPEAKGCPI
jgi:hypothetical protein